MKNRQPREQNIKIDSWFIFLYEKKVSTVMIY